jgi:hypothetical protein
MLILLLIIPNHQRGRRHNWSDFHVFPSGVA